MAAITAITNANPKEMAVSGIVMVRPGRIIFGKDSVRIRIRRSLKNRHLFLTVFHNGNYYSTVF